VIVAASFHKTTISIVMDARLKFILFAQSIAGIAIVCSAKGNVSTIQVYTSVLEIIVMD
jgi:hypothetical protein